MSDGNARHRKLAEEIDDALSHAECTCRNHALRPLTYEERVDVIAARLKALEGDPPEKTKGVINTNAIEALDRDIALATSPEHLAELKGDPPPESVNAYLQPILTEVRNLAGIKTTLPPEGLEDAVTDILLEYGVASKPLTIAIVATVKPFCQISKPVKGLEDAVRELVRDKFIGVMCDEHHADDIINIIIAAVQPLLDKLQADNDKLKKALRQQSELWSLVSNDLAQLDRQRGQVLFMELHDPMGKIKEALDE